MTQVYSLPTPTVGQWARVQLPSDTQAIMFKNDSSYDFLLYFGGTSTPSFTTSPGGQAHGQVNATEYPVIPTNLRGASGYERQLNGVGAWDGNLWYLAQDNTGNLALTGTFSGRVVLSLITYGPLDAVPPSGQAVARQVDLTSQPRIVVIPMTPFASYSWDIAATAGNDYQPFPAFVAATNPNTDVGCQIYIYYLQVSPDITDGNMAFAFRLICRDFNNAATILATVDLQKGFCGKTGNVGESWVFNPAVPYHFLADRGGAIPANTGIIEIALHDYGSTAAWPCHASILIDSDKTTPGLVVVPGIGGGIDANRYAAGIPKY